MLSEAAPWIRLKCRQIDNNLDGLCEHAVGPRLSRRLLSWWENAEEPFRNFELLDPLPNVLELLNKIAQTADFEVLKLGKGV